MAFDRILMRQREIREGPGAKTWALGQITDNPTPVRLGVCGLTSNCSCTGIARCSYCKESTSVWLLIVGAFNPDLHQRGFVFWGYINRDANGDALLSAPRPEARVAPRNYTSVAPSRSQLVFGWYDPYNIEERGWIAPVEGTLEELFHTLVNTDMLRRDFRLWGKRGSYDFDMVSMTPDVLWGMYQRQTEGTMSLRHVERKVEGTLYFKVTGVRTLDAEGRLMQEPDKDGAVYGATWFRFLIELEFIPNTGEEGEAYADAWIDICEDGSLNYVWARDDDGSKVSWVCTNYKK